MRMPTRERKCRLNSESIVGRQLEKVNSVEDKVLRNPAVCFTPRYINARKVLNFSLRAAKQTTRTCMTSIQGCRSRLTTSSFWHST